MEKRSLLKKITIIILLGILLNEFSGTKEARFVASESKSNESSEALSIDPTETLIRFHVIANSDQEEDQALKRAVRDAILRKVSPILALSRSLEESRRILIELRPEMEEISRQVIKDWGHSENVTTDYGTFTFPTKSYGSLVLPAGDYEAVRILIGKAEGSNWWCVLFPPLCFIDIEHSTAVQVDGKPGIPLGETLYPQANKPYQASKSVKFYFWEKIKEFKQS